MDQGPHLPQEVRHEHRGNEGVLAACLQGETSIPVRKVLLAEKRERLVEQLAEVQASIDYIDWKQGFYDDVLAGRTEYYSNLLPAEG